jgi:hemin uptake protein HemP
MTDHDDLPATSFDAPGGPPSAAPAANAARLPPGPVPAVQAPQRWSSSELLGEAKEVEIVHDGMVYRLRQTALGKLILTK